MIRRSAVALCALLALAGVSSCSTFQHQDAVARVNSATLSRDDLAQLLTNRIVQDGVTGEIDAGTATGTQADRIIGIWVVLSAFQQSGVVDLSGTEGDATLTKQYPADWPNAAPAVKQLLLRYTAYAAKQSAGGLDTTALRGALEDADIHVDSRYGYWDDAKAAVVAFA